MVITITGMAIPIIIGGTAAGTVTITAGTIIITAAIADTGVDVVTDIATRQTQMQLR